MDKAGQAKIAQGGWPTLGLVVLLLFLYICGVHLGQIVAIADPWPDNMAALFAHLPYGGRVFRRIGGIILLLFATVTLAGLPAFRSPACLMEATRDRLRRLDRRHAAIVIGCLVFGLPLFIGAEMFFPKFLSVVIVLVFGGALLINRGIAGCAVLGLAWVMAGSLVSDEMVRHHRDLDKACRPAARIALKNGQTLACTSIQQLGLYQGVLIRDETGSTFVPVSELEPQSVIDAVGPMGRFLF